MIFIFCGSLGFVPKIFPQSFSNRLIEKSVRFAVMTLGRIFYRVRVEGLEHFPRQGGAVVVCNHVSYADTIPLTLACPRKLRFTSFEGLFAVPLLGRCLTAFGSIPVSPDRAKEALQRAADCAKSGECVLLFPEGKITLDGRLQEIKRGYELIARRADVPVVAVRLDGLWGSIFSNERGKFFFKWPQVWRRDITVRFSAPVEPTRLTPELVRAAWEAE